MEPAPLEDALGPASRVLTARNPATGLTLAHLTATDPSDVANLVVRSRATQRQWSALGLPARLRRIDVWRGILARDAEAWASAIRDEVGKPYVEAMAEVVSTLDALRWTVKNAGRVLADQRLGAAWQVALLIPSAKLQWVPLGVVGILGTWNYPFLLNAPAIAHALASGNGVVWKPSEQASLLGVKLQRSLEEAGFPAELVGMALGGPEVGRALVAAPIDKLMYTGGVEGGRSVLAALGSRGVPAIVELSGFDAAIILPDAPRDSTLDALTWAAFVGAGQTCVAVKRIYVVGDATPWAEALGERARKLRLGDPASPDVDVGPMISDRAVDRFQAQISAAVAAGARVLAGGSRVEGLGSFFQPTVLLSEPPEPEACLAGCFGPVVLVRGVPDVDSAVLAANASDYGLSASVWGRNLRQARAVAIQLEAGSVAVNEAVTTSAHAAAPFGGTRSSGFGRIRGAVGLRELAQPRVVHVRRSGGFRPQLFPYPGRMLTIFQAYRRIFHRKG